MNEHGYCPNCDISFDGGLIWESGIKMYGDVEKADKYAAAYGATRTTGHWNNKIGIYDMERDTIGAWRCPDCGHEWERNRRETGVSIA